MTNPQKQSRERTIAGWPVRHIATAVLLTVNTLWGAWATKTLVELQQRQIVTVGLSGLVREFVAEESRRASSPEAAAARTRLYLTTLDRAVRDLERDGAVVLVSESVLGAAVPDRTTLVRARVARAMRSMP